MKSFVLAYLLIAVTSAASLPHSRPRRDVSEIVAPVNNYLPPEQEMNTAEEATEISPKAVFESPEETAILGDSGYEYKTIRKLKYRTRRDVSELISRNYLPPTLELSNKYLSPVEQAFEMATETPVVSSTLAQEEIELSTPAETKSVSQMTEEPEKSEELVTEMPQDTTYFSANDGYHYKKPEQIPQLVSHEYLTPIEEGGDAIIVEGPREQTAILADDGYHYRAIKRLRF